MNTETIESAALAAEPGKTVLKRGMIVYLTSGGPPMTVVEHDIEADRVECHWFWRGLCHTETFYLKELMYWEGEADARPADPWRDRATRRDRVENAFKGIRNEGA